MQRKIIFKNVPNDDGSHFLQRMRRDAFTHDLNADQFEVLGKMATDNQRYEFTWGDSAKQDIIDAVTYIVDNLRPPAEAAVTSQIVDGVNRVGAELLYREAGHGLVRKRLHTLDHSLKRHHYSYLEGDPKPLNSIVHGTVNDAAVIADGKAVGEAIQAFQRNAIDATTNVALTTAADGRTYTVNGRDYLTEGVAGMPTPIPNHFFATRGTDVWDNVSAADYGYVKRFKAICGAAGPSPDVVSSLLTGHVTADGVANFLQDLPNISDALVGRFFTISGIGPATDGFRDAILFAKQAPQAQLDWRYRAIFDRLKDKNFAHDLVATRCTRNMFDTIKDRIVKGGTSLHGLARQKLPKAQIFDRFKQGGAPLPSDPVLDTLVDEMIAFVG